MTKNNSDRLPLFVTLAALVVALIASTEGVAHNVPHAWHRNTFHQAAVGKTYEDWAIAYDQRTAQLLFTQIRKATDNAVVRCTGYAEDEKVVCRFKAEFVLDPKLVGDIVEDEVFQVHRVGDEYCVSPAGSKVEEHEHIVP